MAIAATILATLIFVAYLIYSFICNEKKIPGSVSETYYIIPYPRMLTVVYWSMALLMLPSLLETTKETLQFLAFLFPSSIAMVGAFADYAAGKHILIPHMIFTWIAIICSVVWTIFATSYWWILVIMLAIFTIVMFVTKTQKTCMSWWMEIALFLSVFVTLLVILI